jgi:HK97 family phage major capsid protein
MSNTDALIARYAGELEERQQFIEGLVESAQSEQRDLDSKELELITRSRDRIQIVNGLLDPLRETLRITSESQEKTARLAGELAARRSPELVAKDVNYRSAGAYVMDVWRAGLGSEEVSTRLELYHRAAAHQTTGDNPGLLPDQILGPILNYVDTARPIVNALGPRQLPNGSWSRPRVTQHTQVGVQSGEKTELVSRKMIIGKVPVSPVTYGGYVNVSRQDVDWTQPQIMDIIINDLAGQYALQTEAALAAALIAGGTAADASTTIPTGAATAAQVSGAVWSAAGKVLAASAGQGRLILAVAPDMLGLIGPLFPPVNPTNAQSAGFDASGQMQGPQGAIAGVTVVMSAGLPAGTILMASSAAVEVYEDRIGALQVVEPSVLGIQVAYAGYFTQLVLLATGVQKIVKTP